MFLRCYDWKTTVQGGMKGYCRFNKGQRYYIRQLIILDMELTKRNVSIYMRVTSIDVRVLEIVSDIRYSCEY